MLIFLATTFAQPALGCTMFIERFGERVSPAQGDLLPPGFAIQLAEGQSHFAQLEDSQGDLLELERGDGGVMQAPQDMEPGLYTLFDESGAIDIEVGEPEGEEPAAPELSDLRAHQERVTDSINGMCRVTARSQHRFVTLTLDLPASELDGWVVEARDRISDQHQRFALSDQTQVATPQWDLGKERDDPALCLTLTLFDAQGAEVFVDEQPCLDELEASCSSAPGRAGGLLAALMALVGVGRRRRR